MELDQKHENNLSLYRLIFLDSAERRMLYSHSEQVETRADQEKERADREKERADRLEEELESLRTGSNKNT
jgi:hypothetical protein